MALSALRMFDVEDDVDFESLDARKFFFLSASYSFIDSAFTHPFFVCTTISELHKTNRHAMPPHAFQSYLPRWLPKGGGNLNFFQAMHVMTNSQVGGSKAGWYSGMKGAQRSVTRCAPVVRSSSIGSSAVLSLATGVMSTGSSAAHSGTFVPKLKSMYTGIPVAAWGFLFGDVTQMMAYNYFKSELDHWNPALPTPLMSGFLSMSLCSVPCNVTMVLFRQQVYLRTRGLPYSFKYLVTERLPNLEGGAFKSLLRGTIVSSISAIPSVAIGWQVYESTKTRVREWTGSNSVFTSVISGAVSGVVDALVTRPVSVVTSRMHTDKTPRPFWATARTLLMQEGPKSFYKGIGSQMLANVPRMGLFYSVYQSFVTWAKKEDVV